MISPMRKKQRVRRCLRWLFNYLPTPDLTSKSSWQWLRYYPAVIPAPFCFEQWNTTDNTQDSDYQTWIEQHCLTTLNDWRILQAHAYHNTHPVKISLVTPVYNTAAAILYECIISVRAQAYPYWQFILVDDGSSSRETQQLLNSGVCKDPRIQVLFLPQSRGISAATNLAIDKVIFCILIEI